MQVSVVQRLPSLHSWLLRQAVAAPVESNITRQAITAERIEEVIVGVCVEAAVSKPIAPRTIRLPRLDGQ